MPDPHPHLAVIGGGNMARAIVGGGIRAGVLDPRRVAVAEPDPAKHPCFAELRVRTFAASLDALAWLVAHGDPERDDPSSPAGQILLAVKPQSLSAVATEIGQSARQSAPSGVPARGRVVISILAGTPSSRIRELLGAACAVVRAMPNTPARLGEAVTAVALGDGARPGDDDFALRLFRGIGPVVLRCDEPLMDAYTAVSGSGPAYVFYLAEAMLRAAEAVGIPPEDAERAVRQTIIGAAALLGDSPEPFAALRAAVTSKGGTTEAATGVLNTHDTAASIVEAIKAARDRGRVLGRA